MFTRATLYLYDGVPELWAITGRTGVGGYSAIDASHVPFDNDQTRFHEMVHIVAYRLPKSGERRAASSTSTGSPTRCWSS